MRTSRRGASCRARTKRGVRVMRNLTQQVALMALVGFCAASVTLARADDRDHDDRDVFTVTNLVSGTAPPPNTILAPTALATDNQLLNAWGIAFFPNGP